MAKAVEYHPGARTDHDQPFDWYAERSDRAALGFLAAVDEAIDRIVADPNAFPAAPAGCRFASLRRYPFRIVFRDDLSQILIVAVAHAKRRPNYWKKRT
jgi:plasmid stabilization system protein ParE